MGAILDRQIIYPGQIPQDTDLLLTNKNAMVGLAKLAAAALGVNGVVNGLQVVPTGPASLNVNVNPGEIYMLENIDATSYGSIAADTTHQVLKQGIMLDVALLSCPAPGTGGQSINYLVQAAFSETDTGTVALPYYNASNPSVAWSGPNNTGTPQATQRSDKCVVTVKAGAAAATGTQTTPTPDAGNIGLAVVTVANGQATITAANIVQYTGASLVPSDGLASNVAHAIYTKNVAGAADVTLTAQEAAYPILVLQGALTGNINLIVPASSRQRIIDNETSGAFQITVKTAAGTGVVVPQGYTLPTFCDGTNVESAASALLTQAQGDARYQNSVQGGFKNLQASATGTTANVSVSADEIVLENGTNLYQTVRAVALTIAGTASGVANGLDTGALAASTWYSLWVIWNGTTVAGLMSLSATAPTLPSGYTHKARVGWIRTDGTANKYPLSFLQYGRQVQYKVAAGSNLAALPIMASGTVGAPTTPTWVAIGVASFVPSTANRINVAVGGQFSTGSAVICAPNNSYGSVSSTTNPPPFSRTAANAEVDVRTGYMTLESANIYWASGSSAGAFVACNGWEDNL